MCVCECMCAAERKEDWDEAKVFGRESDRETVRYTERHADRERDKDRDIETVLAGVPTYNCMRCSNAYTHASAYRLGTCPCAYCLFKRMCFMRP